MFSGSLPEYLEAVKALQVRAIFVYAEKIDESDFLVEADAGDVDDDDDDDAADADADADADDAIATTVDLCTVNKKLVPFKERFGQVGLFWLSASLQNEHLDLALDEPWWREFLEIRDEAIERIMREGEQREAAALSSKRAETEELIGQLHELAEDSSFAKLPTQKAMFQYALRVLPKLKVLDDRRVKIEIQELKAKIDSGG
jgi:hypothetical protein